MCNSLSGSSSGGRDRGDRTLEGKNHLFDEGIFSLAAEIAGEIIQIQTPGHPATKALGLDPVHLNI